MVLGIDASNLRRGGGVTHLVELLRAARPAEADFSKVIVWGCRGTLDKIDDQPWLTKVHLPVLEGGLARRIDWQRTSLSRLAREAGCSVIFVPGGSYAGDFRPVVAMSQNLLPFDGRELRRFGFSLMSLKLFVLRYTQGRTFRNADGVIFLTRYARDAVVRVVRRVEGPTTIIPHGIDARFDAHPRPQLGLEHYSPDHPFRLLYVSIVDVYKHQWNVAEAVANLRAAGVPLTLDLVGPAYPPAERRLRRTLRRIDPSGKFIRYVGAVRHEELQPRYAAADMFVFASSCENLPNILLEAMASGLPIACSNRGPMPEILKDGGVYFDPENPVDIAGAIQELLRSPDERARMANVAHQQARQFSWRSCAENTFRFLAAAVDARSPRRGSSSPQ